MIIRVTGDERDVANSAWVSTLNEVKAQAKSQEEVERVVKFLVDHHHTSPFESVTLTFEIESEDEFRELLPYQENHFAKISSSKMTIDLLNFTKETYEKNLWQTTPWQLFEEVRPTLAKFVSGFGPIEDSTSEDVTDLLGNHGMTVELIHLHDEGDYEHSRATWRVKCPLSIAVQILRHRKGSYNMVSGRYRTIIQKLVPMMDDVSEISRKANLYDDIQEMWDETENVVTKYKAVMSKLKDAKKEGSISNDEYKRAREYVRFILPEGRMTELYITYYLSDFYNNYKMLRDSVHAQVEHIWIAQEMARTLERIR